MPSSESELKVTIGCGGRMKAKTLRLDNETYKALVEETRMRIRQWEKLDEFARSRLKKPSQTDVIIEAIRDLCGLRKRSI